LQKSQAGISKKFAYRDAAATTPVRHSRLGVTKESDVRSGGCRDAFRREGRAAQVFPHAKNCAPIINLGDV
jgi:hypothetical protein